jgi:hypothetical protein
MPTPALECLMGTYFHQDWDSLGSSHLEVVDQFAIDAPRMAAALPAEVEQVLASPRTDAELEAMLVGLGCQVLPEPEGMGYRDWLVRLSRRASETLEIS